MKVDSDVLHLSYLDKICLTLTGDLWWTLACLYSEARLYKGPREATRPQSTTLHSTGNTKECVNEGSRPQQHTWNSKALFLPAQIYCCTIVYIFNILWRLKVKVSYSKEEASSVLFILTANEHILTGSWLQIIEVAITPVGMSVQWLTYWLVHYFTI